MENANEMPANKTPIKSQSQFQFQSLNIDDIHVFSRLVELSDLPLPNDPDENSSDSITSCSTEVKQTFLLPYAMLFSYTVKVQEAETNKNNKLRSTRLISGRIFENNNYIFKKITLEIGQFFSQPFS